MSGKPADIRRRTPEKEDLGKISDVEREVSNLQDAQSQNEEEIETARVVDSIAERQLCRKFDFRILPVLAVMCKCNHSHDTLSMSTTSLTNRLVSQTSSTQLIKEISETHKLQA